MKEYNYECLVVSGPSGIGKTYIAKYLQTYYPFELVVSTTTRPIRLKDGEVNGVDYHFTNEEHYSELEASGDLFMSNSFHNARYGYQHTAFTGIINRDKIPVAVVYSPVAAQLFRTYSCFGIFLMPGVNSMNLLENRMRYRGENEATIQTRMKNAQSEIDYFCHEGYSQYSQCFTVSDNDISPVVEAVLQSFPVQIKQVS